MQCLENMSLISFLLTDLKKNNIYMRLLTLLILSFVLFSDEEGYAYWLRQLNNYVDSRYDVFIGFSESYENKLLFSQETGIEI